MYTMSLKWAPTALLSLVRFHYNSHHIMYNNTNFRRWKMQQKNKTRCAEVQTVRI